MDILYSAVILPHVSNSKPHIRQQQVYNMGTSGLMLIPKTPLTKCVTECAKCGFSRQANWSGVHCPNGPQFFMAVWVTSEHTYGYAQNARARIWAVRVLGCCIQRLFDTQASHRTLFGAPQCVCIGLGVGIDCAMAFERLVWANEISIFFLFRN